MEQLIRISNLNDFIFCPASIYYHGMYEELDRSVFQDIDQIRGSFVHESVDKSKYSTRKDVLQGIDVYCSKYNLVGKIDIYDKKNKTLVERKNRIVKIYDGYIFQLYAQYFAMVEQGFEISKLSIYSFCDNKSYEIKLPSENRSMLSKFESLIYSINNFDLSKFHQSNIEKCNKCIYAPLCVSGGEKL